MSHEYTSLEPEPFERGVQPEAAMQPREKADFYKGLYPIFKFGLDMKFDREVSGTENIPDQPAIYAPNHIRLADSPLVAASYTEATGLPMRFVAKQEYFDGKGINDNGKFGKTMQWLMEHSYMIPVEREGKNPRAFQQLQTTVGARIEHGDAVALHPEGTRSDDGKLHKFKSGASRIAIALSVPIVPVGLVYTEYSNRRKTHVAIEFGQPIMPEEYKTLPYSLFPARQKAEHFIQVAEDRVADITGMPQSGIFAQLRKNRRQQSQKRDDQ
ncbi:MAG: lysophospholipid acyltransferase family protein [Candidatus Microsaccharimonas sp.]